MKRDTGNALDARIDVMVQVADPLAAVRACDSAGRPLTIAQANYDEVLPPNGWPCSLRVRRPGAEAVTYRFGALDALTVAQLRAAQREVAFWRNTNDEANRELMDIWASPVWQQRSSWLVRGAAWVGALWSRVFG